MKNITDLETRLLDELKAWFPRQCRENYADFYLYYRPTTEEMAGDILVVKDIPGNRGSEYLLAMPERINKGASIAQNFNRIRLGVLRRLPVLSV